MNNVSVKKLTADEISAALSLIKRVFDEFEAPEYSRKGIDEFYNSIYDKEYLSNLCIYGAFLDKKLVGVIATRSNGSHIALFFVDGKYHRRGIGRQLFETVLKNCTCDKMTVNSSPYAVPIYHKLGFCDTAEEQTVNGIRFTPMELKIPELKVTTLK